MTFSRRRRHYKRCQEIIDYIHERVSVDGTLHEEECIAEFGRDDYLALMHELHLMGADTTYQARHQAMEWLHNSRHFSHKAWDEVLQYVMSFVSFISAIVAVAAAVFTWYSRPDPQVITPVNGCYCTTDGQNQIPDTLK